MSLIVAHTSYTYDTLYDIDYISFQDLVGELCIKLQYQATCNLMAKDYTDESVLKMVTDSNPIVFDQNKLNKKSSHKHEKLTLNKLKELKLI